MSYVRKRLAGKTTKLTTPKKTTITPSLEPSLRDGSFCIIDIALITPDPNQPRKFFNETALGELAQSIRQSGVLQPILIRTDKDNKVWLVAGERRLKASKLAGISKIPAIITTGNPSEIALIENLQREDLKPVEVAEGYSQILSQYNYTQKELAKIVGKARSTVSEILTLTKLPLTIRKECRTSDIPQNVLLEIAKQPDEEQMDTLFKRAKKSNFTVASIRQLTRKRPEKREKNSQVFITLTKIQALSKNINQIKAEHLSENEKEEISKELKTLISTINTVFP